MQIQSYIARGVNQLNEDALIINNELQIYGVADGVSSLVSFKNEEDLTGGYLASHEVKRYFESIKSSEKLFHGLSKVNHSIQEKMKENQIDTNKKEQLWGTALAIVKITNKQLHYIQTGDCMCIAVYDNKKVRVLTRLQVEHLENIAIQNWEENISRGVKTRNELIKQVKPILLANRQKSNSVNGYGILNGEAAALEYIESGTINRNGLTHIIIMTDGMFLPQKMIPEGENFWDYITSSILDKGLQRYTENLISVEETDPECIEYPRFKKSDDKAGIVINF